MGKISIYVLLCLIYVGFSKSVISIHENIPFLKSEKIFDSFFQNAPISVVLIKTFKKGFFLKSYFLKIRVVHGYFPSEDLIIQTSEDFYNKNLYNLGMAIYQRKTLESPGRSIPQPGGSIFIGDLTFGSWKIDHSGDRVWEFHRAFRFFPEILGWGDYRPSLEFYQKLKINETFNRPFYGLTGEFGTSGHITSKYFLKPETIEVEKREPFITHLKNLFLIQFKKGKKNE
jgi:hypothetical protein